MARRAKPMQSAMDFKSNYYQPDGSGRDYYIALQQNKGRVDLAKPGLVDRKTLPHAGIDIITHQPKALVGIPADVVYLASTPPTAPPSDDPFITDVRNKIVARGGIGGFRGLVRVLRIMDDNGNKRLDREEFRNGLQTYGINPTRDQMDKLLAYFDRNGDGTVDITEFVRGIRPGMNQRRRSLVLQAFALLDVVSDGRVTMQELKALYDTSRHPEVIAGTKTPQQVLIEFSQGWNKNGDEVITPEEFLDYYEDISCCIDLDDYFELMVRNAWHISGGEGVCENTTCRRVLVVHTDGSQSIQEVKNDLRVNFNDMAEVRRRLEAQGVNNIAQVILREGAADSAPKTAKPKAILPTVEVPQPRTVCHAVNGLPLQASRKVSPWETTNQAMQKVPHSADTICLGRR